MVWIVCVGLGVGEECADRFAFDNLADISGDFEIEDKEWDVALLAHGQGGHVHDAESFVECFGEGQRFVAGRCWIFVRICGVDPINFGCFEEDVAVELGCSQGSTGVGGEEGVARSCCEDDNASFFEVTDGSASDEGFGNGSDIERGHDAGVDSDGVEFLFKCDRVHDGAEHTHVVCCGLLYVPGFGELGSSDDVSASNDDGDLSPGLGSGFNFICDGAQFFGGYSETARGAEGLA